MAKTLQKEKLGPYVVYEILQIMVPYHGFLQIMIPYHGFIRPLFMV